MQDLKNFQILVVDDDPDLREILFSIFESQGFSVLEADSGISAFDKVQKNPVDLVVSDIRMPGGDGLTLLDKIRSLDHAKPIVILITGFSDVSTAECIRKGAFGVFPKPFDQKLLINTVKDALRISH